MGIGYHDKLQWAIYSPSTGKIRHGNLNGAPLSESLGGDFGYPFSPFFKPDEAEVRYCLKMADWWAEIETRRESTMKVHQVGDACNVTLSKSTRQHRLISEAGPLVPPSGYFDCTVEVLWNGAHVPIYCSDPLLLQVLNGHLNDNGVYSLYVTDYTINAAVPPVQASWCSPKLADYVLKIEAWDDAVEVAQGMFTGEYFSIKNARMMISHGGYLEGKVVEKKIQKLDVKEDGPINDNFKAFLDRKKAWQDDNNSVDHSDEFENKTINEAVEGKHFHCVVEVLHAVYEGDGTSCIYVTDYTSRDELFTGRVQNAWGGAGLDGRILKIVLFNNQAEMAKTVQVGSFYAIKKLRLKQSTTARHFRGQLGGVERLIHLLHPNTDDQALHALKQRKEKWQKDLGIYAVSSSARDPVKAKPVEAVPVGTLVSAHHGGTIAELQASSKSPNKSRIFARVVDFRPWKLSDAIIGHCTQCKRDLSHNEKACVKCNDSDHEYVRYIFQMYFMLQDEHNNQLQISVHDGSSLFDNLERGEIVDGSKTYNALSARLGGILGDLLESHSKPFPKGGTFTLPNTPMLSMIIDTWDVNGKHAYCLAGCEELAR
ncbi:hypothetical protein C0991_002409 [Blastosporella zonata]|nr:hypothetical protein C0991_002409 [Blastosporella zonata]